MKNQKMNNNVPLIVPEVNPEDIFEHNVNTYVGRIRKDESIFSGINMWVVADNLRKGAATNAIQILQLLLYTDNS